MRPSPAALLPLALAAALAAQAPGRVRATVQEAPPTPEEQAAIAAYLRDPVAGSKILADLAQQPGAAVSPLYAVLVGDAAARAGRYRTASAWFTAARDGTANPALIGLSEMGLAWAALGRGRLADAVGHLEAAMAGDPGRPQTAEFAVALVGAANGAPDAQDALARVASHGALDPALREVAPLASAYARYWAGDLEGAIEAFTAFAVANPDSRFTDDALYAAAWAKRRAGRAAEAQADLEALAGEEGARSRATMRLVELDGRAVLREGMRRDSLLPTRTLPRRLADLLDGDGVRLAQAALAVGDRRDDPTETPAEDVAAAETEEQAEERSLWVDADASRATDRAGSRPTPATTSGDAPSASRPDAAPFPWTSVLALAALGVLVAAFLLGRGGRSDQARQR